MKSRKLSIVVGLLLVLSFVAASCAPATAQPAPVQPATAVPPTAVPPTAVPPTAAPKKVVLIGNQKFGDLGTMDSMAAGLDKCASQYGLTIKKVESTSPGSYEDDIRGMANQGYDLIMTTFPQMQDATTTVAKEFPKIDFAAIFQFSNMGKVDASNMWSTGFGGNMATYLIGMLGAKLSKTKKLGIVAGQEDPSINGELNGYIKGIKDTCPTCKVEVAYAGSYEDPAKGKEITLAMISRGVDFVQTWAAKTGLGVIDGAKQGKIFVSGEVSDNSALYPEGYVNYVGIDFGANVVLACKDFAEGKFPGGTHSDMTLLNGAYYVSYDLLDKYAKANPAYSQTIQDAITQMKAKQQEFMNGNPLPVDTSSPKSG